MSWLYRKRASTILYEYLVGLNNEETFLVPANSCPIVPATFLKAQVPFHLVDIDPEHYLIDLQKVENILTSSTSNFGLLFIRPLGFMDDRSHFFTRLKSLHPQLRIVDDRCLATPTFDSNELSPEVDLTLFSTGYSKIVEHGTGGYAFYNGDSMEQTGKPYEEQHHDTLISSFKKSLDEESRFVYTDTDWLDFADPALSFAEYRQLTMSNLKFSLAHKKTINQIFQEQLGDNSEIQLLGEKYSQWRFNFLTEKRDLILKAIFSQGLFASSHYASLAGIFDNSSAPIAGNVGRRILNLFNDHRISESTASKLCDIVNEVTQASNAAR